MNLVAIGPAPAPCKEPVPTGFRPRAVATELSRSILVEPVSRTNARGDEPLIRTGTKIIPLRQSKAKWDTLRFPAESGLRAESDTCAWNTRGNIANAIASRGLETRRQALTAHHRVGLAGMWLFTPCPLLPLFDDQSVPW